MCIVTVPVKFTCPSFTLYCTGFPTCLTEPNLDCSFCSYTSLHEWLAIFLLGSLRKAWAGLVVEGHCVIHIADVFKTKVCEAMCLMATWQLPCCRYVGVMNSRGMADRPRPMWVFQKMAQPPNPDHLRHTGEQLRRYDPELYRMVLEGAAV